MRRIKLFVEFERPYIKIQSEDDKIKCIMPYNFDNKYGEKNIELLFQALGFDVEMKKGWTSIIF